MSFAKAERLLELARLASGRYSGMAIRDVERHFSVSRRTAQRMLSAMHDFFPNATVTTDDEGLKRWRVPPTDLRDYISILPEEMAALEIAVTHLERSGSADDAGHLRTLGQKTAALMPSKSQARFETDLEALLEAQGLAARPGPRPILDSDVTGALSHAIKACRQVDILYRSHNDRAPRQRTVKPYGFLTGLRRYLIARNAGDGDGPMRLFRLEDIREARVTPDSFERDEDFSPKEFANRAFGVFQDDREYGPVVWRFLPEAAEHAARFEFHPGQETERLEDGSLLVRFSASGHLEMCWHLYVWGDKVEVLEPQTLSAMVERYRRDDFTALP